MYTNSGIAIGMLKGLNCYWDLDKEILGFVKVHNEGCKVNRKSLTRRSDGWSNYWISTICHQRKNKIYETSPKNNWVCRINRLLVLILLNEDGRTTSVPEMFRSAHRKALIGFVRILKRIWEELYLGYICYMKNI